MHCFVCNGELKPFFEKEFNGQCELTCVEYVRCESCHLALSKTHFEMSDPAWQTLNRTYHEQYQGKDSFDDDPRWMSRLQAQSETIIRLAKADVLRQSLPWVDYACGDGKLADMLAQSNIEVSKFERFMPPHGSGYVSAEEMLKEYDLVINTSVFEHLRDLETLDEIAGLVGENGALALHVMVKEEIPADPTWSYLLPVHCVFYSNRSMQVLFDRWNFESCIYHVPSRMWFMFRTDRPGLREFVEKEASTGSEDFHFKEGFVDYWK